MKERIQDLLRTFKTREAFWAAAENVMTDSYCQSMFLRIANQRELIVLVQEDIDRIKELADSGNPYMQYAFARLHDVLGLQPDSCDICEKYYTLALNAGIADAGMQLAFMYRDADLGEVDNRRFLRYFNEALDSNSERAVQFKLNQMIHGSKFFDSDPQKALELITNYLKDSVDPDPYYYRLKALAEEKLELNQEAERDYQLAIGNGDIESFFLLAVLKYADADGNVLDLEAFSQLMEQGQQAGSASAYLEMACILNSEMYEALDEQNKADCHSLLKDQLELSATLGETTAAYSLGYYYENAEFGFEKDLQEAWSWYAQGSILRSADSYEALSRMVLEDGTAPENYGEEFGYECAYRAYILGADTLECLIRGYKSGHLTSHAAMIEEFFLPAYESMNEDYDDYDEPEIEED